MGATWTGTSREATMHYRDSSPGAPAERPEPPRTMTRAWCDRTVQLDEATSIRRLVRCPECRAAADIKTCA